MKTLVILAAGMGSRFGGLKQIEPVGLNGEILADYSVYDAIRNGFDNVIFIIQKENEEYFTKNIIAKYKDKIKVKLVFQDLSKVPSDVKIPSDAKKTLGTAHALYCAKEFIDGDFLIINSDDFYGRESFELAANFMNQNKCENEYLSVNYPVYKTMNYEKVKRGVIIENDGFINLIIESEISKDNDKYIAKSLFDDQVIEIPKDALVSVNFFVFKKSFLDYLSIKFDKYIHSKDFLNKEFILSEVLKTGLLDNAFKIKSVLSNGVWIGMTYREDLESVKMDIEKLIRKKEYPRKLW